MSSRFRLVALILLMLLLYTVLPVSRTPVSAAGDTAGTQEELLSWMKNHSRTGGTLSLTKDIIITEDVELAMLKKTTIDCNTHTVAVKSNVDIMGQVEICGIGVPDGMFRIGSGGVFSLSIGAKITADSGIAVWQEEGAAFVTESANVNAHYAKLPTIVQSVNPSQMYAIVPKGGSYKSFLPTKIDAIVNKNGSNSKASLPVSWDTVALQRQLEGKKRTDVKGSFEGYRVVKSLSLPLCTVIFREHEVTFEHAASKSFGDSVMLFLNYLTPSHPITVTLQYSFDEKNWMSMAPQDCDVCDGVDDIQLMLIKNAENSYSPAEDEILLPPSYTAINFVISWEEDGKTCYSDVIRFNDNGFTSGQDVEGNRGGGEELMENPGLSLPGDVATGNDKDKIIVNGANDSKQQIQSQPLPRAKAPGGDKLDLSDKPIPEAQSEQALQISNGAGTPKERAQQPSQPWSMIFQIIAGTLITAAILFAFIYHGRKR